MYLGRAPCTKENLLDFRERCRVARHSRVFHGLTASPGFGASQLPYVKKIKFKGKSTKVLYACMVHGKGLGFFIEGREE